MFYQSVVDNNSALYFLLATILTYFYMERKRLLHAWYKCKRLILKYEKPKSTVNNAKRLSLKLVKWDYRGEGNEYLAISLPELKQILRLRKCSDSPGLHANLCLPGQHVISDIEARNLEKLNLEYYKVVTSLIGECYVQPAEEVLLLKKEIELLNKVIFPLRPEHRKMKYVKYACGSLLTDYAYLPRDWDHNIYDGPNFAVELKPKQGWIPYSERLYHLCSYCLNQYIKLENGDITDFSQFCPMDLFSGEDNRMIYAIKCLLKTPQNNFKIFQEGRLIYGDGANNEISDILCSIFKEIKNISYMNVEDEFCHIIVRALLRELHISTVFECLNPEHTYNFIKTPLIDIPKQNFKKICKFNRNSLPSGCVLDRILNLQALDIWGAEAVSLLWDDLQYKTNNNTHAENVIKRGAYTPNGVVCAKCFFDDNFTKYPATNGPINNAELITQQYLMSAIAKDCSLMITFKYIKDMNVNIPKQNIITTENGMYAFNVGVFDLYPKPLTCLLKHARKRSKFNDIYSKLIQASTEDKMP